LDIGFELTIQHYSTRITVTMNELHRVAQFVLPANRAMVDQYMFCYGFDTIDELLSGVKKGIKDEEWDNELFEKFSEYVKGEEARLKAALVAARWRIDAADMLALITGPGRLEKVSLFAQLFGACVNSPKYVLPLLLLLLEQHVEEIKKCGEVVVKSDALLAGASSLDVLWVAVDSRVDDLRGSYLFARRFDPVLNGLCSHIQAAEPRYRT
jgi:hypothetical protein